MIHGSIFADPVNFDHLTRDLTFSKSLRIQLKSESTHFETLSSTFLTDRCERHRIWIMSLDTWLGSLASAGAKLFFCGFERKYRKTNLENDTLFKVLDIHQTKKLPYFTLSYKTLDIRTNSEWPDFATLIMLNQNWKKKFCVTPLKTIIMIQATYFTSKQLVEFE